MKESPARLSRRSAIKLASAGIGLAVAGAGGAAVLGGSAAAAAPVVPAESAKPATIPAEVAAYPSYSEIGGTPTWYDDSTPAPASFPYNSTFHTQLETWWTYYLANAPTGWATPARIYSLGVFNDGRDSAAHNVARGFDLSRIYAHNGSALFWPFETYSKWSGRSGSELTLARKRYWATAASLHRNFKNVLTYLYNSDHYSHIHIDNLVYGGGESATFDRDSTAQVQHVQACLTYIWGYQTTMDGVWGTQSSLHATAALERAGGSGNLATGTNWVRFNTATFRFGSGREGY